MYFYPFHVTDYLSHTTGLSPLEDLAYRRILDHYFLHEAPPNGTAELIARRIGLPENQTETQWVLNEYFEQDDNGNWLNKRAEQDIADYQSRAEVARENGKKGGRPKKEPTGNPTETQSVSKENPDLTGSQANQEPITNNQEPNIKTRRFAPPTAMDVAAYADKLGKVIDAQGFVDFYESKGWMVGKNKMKSWEAAVRNWIKRDGERPPPGASSVPAPKPGVRSSRDMPLEDMLNDRSWAE